MNPVLSKKLSAVNYPSDLAILFSKFTFLAGSSLHLQVGLVLPPPLSFLCSAAGLCYWLSSSFKAALSNLLVKAHCPRAKALCSESCTPASQPAPGT